MDKDGIYLYHVAGSFAIFAGICALALVFVVFCVPETKGKTLEEIQAFFK